MREEMTELEVCRLSAEALAKHIGHISHGEVTIIGCDENGEFETRWNPILNAEQRWECVEWLLAAEYALTIWNRPDKNHTQEAMGYAEIVQLECPASEFPARCVAELQRRKA